MLNAQTEQSRIDEFNRCQDRSWLSVEDEQLGRVTNPVNLGENQGKFGLVEPDASNDRFERGIRISQEVFLPGDQFIGMTTKLFRKPGGQISHLAVRTARLFGRHKIVPIAYVSEVTPSHVLLSINRGQFIELPKYQTDVVIAEEADQALWNDVVLRDTDYPEIDVRVRDGLITLNGHVTTSVNQWRVETTVKNIPGILGVKSYLIPDDKLTLAVAEALGLIEKAENCRFFTKVENGLVVLMGEVISASIRDRAEQCVAVLPWVRGVINEIHVPGIVVNSEEQRFFQPLIGKALLFKDGLSVILQKVVINPHNRRVVAMVVEGQFPGSLRPDQNTDDCEEHSLKRLVVIPVRLILSLEKSGGFLLTNSTETVEFEDYDPSRFIIPGQDWLPPYPYCTDEVLFHRE